MLIPYNEETNKLNEKIFNDSSSGTAQRDFVQAMINNFYASDGYKEMLVSQRYYENNNDINKAKRTVIGKDAENNPIQVESKVLANNKLTHNFYKKLVRQKIAYMVARPFIMQSSKVDDPLTDEFVEKVADDFDLDFYKMLKNVCKDSIIKKLGWLQVYYDNDGILKFKRIPPEEAIPIWEDIDHTQLSAFIRTYTVDVYNGADKQTITYIEYYTKEGVYYYRKDGEQVVVDTSEYDNGMSSNFRLIKKDENGVDVELNVNWTKLPFIPFKYDPDEQTLLVRIKALIDDYDKKTSNIANQIDDIPNSITVVKNYDGASKEEFTANKNQYRTIFVQGDGDAKSLETPLDIAGLDVHLERLRQDIYEFGQGVNTSNKDIRDTSGVALRFMYSDLDMDCSDWGAELQWSLRLLLWFKMQDYLLKTGKDYTNCKYDIIFDTDVIVNETETIQNCFTSKGVISDLTIASNHPWTRNGEKEVENMLDDKEDILDLEAEYTNKANADPYKNKTKNNSNNGQKES